MYVVTTELPKLPQIYGRLMHLALVCLNDASVCYTAGKS